MTKKERLPQAVREIMKGQEDWIELFPMAVSLGNNNNRPLLILRDKESQMNLPVWLGSLDAAVAMMQSDPRTPESTPHKTTLQILKSLNLELSHCLFTEVTGLHQYVELCFKGAGGVQHVKCRADESMSLCLLAQTRFFAPKGLIRKSQEVDSDLMTSEEAIKQIPNQKLNQIYLN